jgi:type VI secretion system protein ImpK
MSGKDDPFGLGGRTVIRRGAAPRRKADAPPPAAPPRPEPTVFDPGGGALAPAGPVSTGTIIQPERPFTGTVIADAAFSGDAGPAADAAGKETAQFPQEALAEAADRVEYPSANRFLAAAAPLLTFLGTLRLSPAAARAEPLAEDLATFIGNFQRRIADAGIAGEDARMAAFALAETADDIAMNLPGMTASWWKENGMAARFFQAGAHGTGFFAALNKALAEPDAHKDLIELMHACLSLGFEGQYRGAAGQDGALERVRRDTFETLRYFRPGSPDGFSPHWQGQSIPAERRSFRFPVWAAAAMMCAVLAAAFFILRTLVTDQGEALAQDLLALNPATAPTISRSVAVVPVEEQPAAEPEPAAPPPPPETPQIDRIRSALAKEIDGGQVSVETKGDYIVIEIGNALLFASGGAEAKPDFAPVAADIAAALSAEPGPIRIVGHTDNVKPRKSGTFKSNYDLSVARAEAVQKALAPKIGDTARITVEGKGEDEPVADNATPEGRAKNRRVDVMLARKETL